MLSIKNGKQIVSHFLFQEIHFFYWTEKQANIVLLLFNALGLDTRIPYSPGSILFIFSL